jgi:hypothetical protein
MHVELSSFHHTGIFGGILGRYLARSQVHLYLMPPPDGVAASVLGGTLPKTPT